MPATVATNSTMPVEISKFFETVYGCNPQVTQDKKSIIYLVPEKGISITTDIYGGCHIDVKEISVDRIPFARQAIEELSEIYRVSQAFDSIWIDVALPTGALTLGSIAALQNLFKVDQN